jgi:hypothetical protein
LVTCKQFLQELNDYLDPNVDAITKIDLEAHVTQCPNCFVVVDTTMKTLQIYKGMEPQSKWPAARRVEAELRFLFELRLQVAHHPLEFSPLLGIENL